MYCPYIAQILDTQRKDNLLRTAQQKTTSIIAYLFKNMREHEQQIVVDNLQSDGEVFEPYSECMVELLRCQFKRRG